MRKIYFFILTGFLLTINTLAQVSVTNPTNTTPNLAATYTSLANAVTALSGITAISGPVIITLDAGNPETAPAGGYGISFAAATTAVNTITFEGSNNTITASAAHTVGNLSDGIFRLLGADYITIQNFVMQENPANTVNTPAASNNMTEWGVALLRVGPTTNGSQNNTIQNNTISLNIAYRNTFGIYSNARHVANTPTTQQEATAFSGSNSGNKVYANNISNVMTGIVFIGTGVQAYFDTGNDIGGSSVATGNTINNWGGNAQLSTYVANSLISCCIYLNHQVSDNVSYNTINSGTVGTGVSIAFTGIRKEYTGAPPTGTFTTSISNNTITMSSAFTGSNLECIRVQSMNLSTATMNITNNLLLNNAITAAGSTSAFVGILNSSAQGILNITNNTIRGFSTVTTTAAFTGIQNAGAVVTAININNNKVGDAIAGAATYSNATSGGINVIQNISAATTATLNMNNNAIDGFSVVNCGQLTFVYNTSNSPANVNINNNLLGSTTGSLITFSGVQTSTFFGIYSAGGAATGTATIQNNDITGITFIPTATCGVSLMTHSATMLNQTFSNNTFTNLNLKSTGQISLINRGGSMASGQTWTCTNNSIVGTFTKSAAGGTLLCMLGTGSSVNGSTEIETGNNFSNITLTGATTFFGWYNVDGVGTSSGPTKTFSGNTFNNIVSGTSSVIMVYIDRSAAATVSSNTITNISGASISQTGIQIGSANGQGTFTCSANTIANFSGSNGVRGIYANAPSIPTVNISNNDISSLSVTSNTTVYGINIDAGIVVNVNDNLVHDFTVTNATIHGIYLTTGNMTANVYSNKIYSMTVTAAVSSPSALINGLYIASGPTTVNAYNNFIADLNTPNVNDDFAICAFSIFSMTPSAAINLYYNSVYLNAVSTGISFGTAGIYHLTSNTPTTAALTLINNIIVNTSTPNGGGITAAYRRSDFRLDNYTNASDHNLFYAGTPSANRLIFYDGTNFDQTLAAYQTSVSPRDANSISLMPIFVSATDLHLTAANCMIDGRGIPVSGITDDIDLNARHATAPDIGADEFSSTPNTTLAGVAGTAVCEDRTVEATGTTYRTNICDLIARVLPSGGSPVSGTINVCVTLDAAQQYFNGEPYVQRHFDIEPAVSPLTSTARLTLYFSDAEFVNYNTNNPIWPNLPTSVLGNADPNRANLLVTQFHGTPTTTPSTPGNYTGPGAAIAIDPVDADIFWNGSYWAVTFNATGFSGFYVHSTFYGTPLPITVNYFKGSKQGSDHLLNWKVTCISTPSVTLTLERSGSAGGGFAPIYSINADAVRCAQPFDHLDTNPLAGMNYYRLKMTDADGKISYSSIVALLNEIKGFEIVGIAPNPTVNGQFKLNVTTTAQTSMEIVISDMTGRIVQRKQLSLINGFNAVDMNVSGLSGGTYLLYGNTSEGRTRTVSFIKQ